MRTGLVVTFVALALAFGPAASADVFPDLPGLGVAESAMNDRSPRASTTSQVTTSDPASQADRMPTPDAESDALTDSDAIISTAVNADDAKIVHALPGGPSMPLIGEAAGVAGEKEPVAAVVLLAAAVVVLFTRFLYRLNSL